MLFALYFGKSTASGVSTVWQVWLVTWAPLWWGRKSCLA